MGLNKRLGNKKLNTPDKEILQIVYPVAGGIASLFGKNCEVVVHSLENLAQSVTSIHNGHVTGREVGSPMTDYGLGRLSEIQTSGQDDFGHYYTKLDDGRLLKSVSILIRNTKGIPIGFFCINYDLSSPLLDFVRGFSPDTDDSTDNSIEHFPSNLDDLVEKMMQTVLNKFAKQKEFSTYKKNKAVVIELYGKGIFRINGVIDILAKRMGISRYTIYNYIREAKLG